MCTSILDALTGTADMENGDQTAERTKQHLDATLDNMIRFNIRVLLT